MRTSTRKEGVSVSSTDPIARSPINALHPTVRDGWEVSARRTTADLRLVDESPLAKILVRGPVAGALREAVGTRFGRAARMDRAGTSVLAVGSGPGEWLVVGPPGTAEELRADLQQAAAKTGEFVSVIDLTHGRAMVRLSGRRAAETLGKVCGIDLHDRSTPNGAALRCSVAGLATDVVRDDGPDPSYVLHCERSSGQHLFDALLDAGSEFGIDVSGLESA
jgi:sarcosine oxidase subunit gamma